jgi:hypothetical protein
MPTFLVTDKMSPELRARVQASVRGRRAAPGEKLRARSISLLRLGALGLVIFGVWALVVAHERSQQRLEQARSALLERFARESAGVSPTERALVERLRPWLDRARGAYDGDVIADELRGQGALARALSRPSVYLRAPLAGLQQDRGLTQVASQSFKDALVLCLLDPPASRTEKVLVGRARSSLAGGERMQVASHVERLIGALLALPLLTPEFRAQIAAAPSELELERLERQLERAPLKSARRAFKSELFLFAIDEPGGAGGPTELDGERPHHVRVGLVDLTAGKLLFYLRRHVDPSFISPAMRAEYAGAIDSCALGLDVHAAVSGAQGP